MSLSRRIRHRSSRKQLIREAFYCYVLAVALIFLLLHFGRHYSLFSPEEHLPVNASLRGALLWAFIGPVLLILQEYVFRETELGNSFSGLDWKMQRLVLAGAGGLGVATLVAWRWMLPLWGLAAAVVLYLRLSRPKDSL
jgi:hypothetical protein